MHPVSTFRISTSGHVACSRLSVSEYDFQSSAQTDLESLKQATGHVELISSKLKMLDFEDYVPGFLS